MSPFKSLKQNTLKRLKRLTVKQKVQLIEDSLKSGFKQESIKPAFKQRKAAQIPKFKFKQTIGMHANCEKFSQ